MATPYPRTTDAPTMINRRRAWRRGNGSEVIGRDGVTRYTVSVTARVPHCECPAGAYGRRCWHAATVLRRLDREGA